MARVWPFKPEKTLVSNQTLLRRLFYSVALLQPQSDTPTEQEEGAVNFAAVRRQYRPSDDDTHLAKLAGRLHQQLSLQLSGQQLVRAPGWRPQVGKLVLNTALSCILFKPPNFLTHTISASSLLRHWLKSAKSEHMSPDSLLLLAAPPFRSLTPSTQWPTSSCSPNNEGSAPSAIPHLSSNLHTPSPGTSQASASLHCQAQATTIACRPR